GRGPDDSSRTSHRSRLAWGAEPAAKERPVSKPILLSVDDGLARITLNRPERLNAFDAALAAAWEETALEATSHDDVGAVLIDAAGAAFCAGGDEVAMATEMGSGAEIEALAHSINGGIAALRNSSIPVVAAAH